MRGHVNNDNPSHTATIPLPKKQCDATQAADDQVEEPNRTKETSNAPQKKKKKKKKAQCHGASRTGQGTCAPHIQSQENATQISKLEWGRGAVPAHCRPSAAMLLKVLSLAPSPSPCHGGPIRQCWWHGQVSQAQPQGHKYAARASLELSLHTPHTCLPHWHAMDLCQGQAAEWVSILWGWLICSSHCTHCCVLDTNHVERARVCPAFFASKKQKQVFPKRKVRNHQSAQSIHHILLFLLPTFALPSLPLSSALSSPLSSPLSSRPCDTQTNTHTHTHTDEHGWDAAAHCRAGCKLLLACCAQRTNVRPGQRAQRITAPARCKTAHTPRRHIPHANRRRPLPLPVPIRARRHRPPRSLHRQR